MSQTSVPFLPFVKPEIDEETIQGVADVLRSGWITTGPQCQRFEAALSEYCGGRPVRVFNSGTATREIGLRIAGVGPGDEVITTPASWVATSNVILETGATPVFVDIDPATRNLDLDLVEKAITPRTKALIRVLFSGRPSEPRPASRPPRPLIDGAAACRRRRGRAFDCPFDTAVLGCSRLSQNHPQSGGFLTRKYSLFCAVRDYIFRKTIKNCQNQPLPSPVSPFGRRASPTDSGQDLATYRDATRNDDRARDAFTPRVLAALTAHAVSNPRVERLHEQET